VKESGIEREGQRWPRSPATLLARPEAVGSQPADWEGSGVRQAANERDEKGKGDAECMCVSGVVMKENMLGCVLFCLDCSTSLAMHASICGSQGCHVSKRSISLPLAIHHSSNPLTCMSM